MNKLNLYKNIILISCGMLFWTAFLNFLMNDGLIINLLVIIPSLTICFLIFLINKQATIIENPQNYYDKDVIEEVENIHNNENFQDSILFDLAKTRIPKTKDISIITKYMFRAISEELQLVIGIYYQKSPNNTFIALQTFAFPEDVELLSYQLGEGFVGQTAKDMQMLQLQEIPEEYPMVVSGLGDSSPKNIVFIPMCNQKKCIGVLELGFFNTLNQFQIERLQIFVDNVILQMHD
jgi:hypothetical protein